MVIIIATRKAVLILALIPAASFNVRDSEMAGTRFIVMAAVKIVARLTSGTAMPVK